MKLGTRLRCWLLAQCCPKFWESMPKEDKPGLWDAVALRTSAFGPRREIYTKTVKGFVNAYVEARSLAPKLDCVTPFADGELGVEWAIRKHEGAENVACIG